MLLSSEEFTQLKCGAAVSPITDFELYGKTLHISFISIRSKGQRLTRLFIVSPAASAFSERYLGSKTDSRVYTVKLRPLTLKTCSQSGQGWSEGSFIQEVVCGANGIFLLFVLQMANLAHRAGQLLQKQYLIIHPTADGNRHVVFLSTTVSR